MRTVPIDDSNQNRLLDALAASRLYQTLPREHLAQVLKAGELVLAAPGDVIVRQGEPSDALYVILSGEAAVRIEKGPEDSVEIGRLPAPETIGEIGLLLGQPRTATTAAVDAMEMIRFQQAAFAQMYQKIPGFGMKVSQGLALRLDRVSAQVPLPIFDPDDADVSADVMTLLPLVFQQRYRVIPVKKEGTTLTLGVVDDPDRASMAAIHQQLPGVTLRSVRIRQSTFDRLVRAQLGLARRRDSAAAAAQRGPSASPRLDEILERVVAEGASDLHLRALTPPFWRIDGDLVELADGDALGENEAYELLKPVMAERHVKEFEATGDADFAYALGDAGRFRINLFRDTRGTGAVLRLIPAKIMPMDQLGLPAVVKAFCDLPKGLVLVTGPTGSGKSTSLASMLDHINHSRPAHILTLEDPIEYVHRTDKSLITQREIGGHTSSFERALKAALREDPNVLLVGELRDRETVAMTLELANTGHLVFATLHTNTAASTIDRLVDFFPADHHTAIRSQIADTLRGVISQTLLKRIEGGRTAAFEVLVSSFAVANLIREAKTVQIPNSMQAGRAQGNQLMNDELARLVRERKVTKAEALAKAIDRTELEKKLGDG